MLGPLAKAIARATNNSVKDDYVQATAEKLERVVRDYEAMESASAEAVFDFEDYVDAASQYIIKKDKADLKDIREFKRLQKTVDPNQYYKNEMLNALSNMQSMFRIVNVEEKSTETLPESIRPLAKIIGDLTVLDQDHISAPFIKSEAKERIGSNVLKDVIRENKYKEIIQSIARRLPENQDIEELSVSARQRAQNKEDFTRNSVEKKPQYRSITSYHDLPYDVSFAYPRELGTHVGTLGQATAIAIKNINPDSDIGRYLDSRMQPMRSKEASQFFETAQFKTIKDTMERPSRLSHPVMMSKGFIDVRKPLTLDFDVKDWSPVSFLIDDGKEVYEAIVNQGSGLMPKLKEEYMSLISRAEEISSRGNIFIDTNDYPDLIKLKLEQTKLNLDFQKFLQKNGFDSIRYKNEVEASMVGEPKYSYILFRPEQFKATTAKSFDKEDPRFTYNEGGPVERSRSIIPLNIKAFLGDLLGYDTPITEEHLDEEEYQSLIEITRRAKEAGKNIIEYNDYKTQSEGQSQYADVGGGGGNLDFFKKIFDPKYSLKTTLGQARIEEDDDGNTIIRDQYNFNNAGGGLDAIEFAKGIKNAGFNAYAQARNVATAFGSGPGEGSEVIINLGRLTPAEQRRLAQSMSSGS